MPYCYHWWLGSLVVLCQFWVFLRAPWWEKLKHRWDCLPWVSLPISRVWYYQKKCHLLPVSSILFSFYASHSLFSAASLTHLPFVLIFSSILQILVPWTPHLCQSTHPCVLLWGWHCSCAYVTHLWTMLPSQRYKIHSVLCSISTVLLGLEQAVLISLFIIYCCLFWMHICWKEVQYIKTPHWRIF